MFAILIPSNQSRSHWTPILVTLTLRDILAGNSGFQIKIWSQLPWGQPTSEIKLPPRKFTCPSFFFYFHVVISSISKDIWYIDVLHIQLYSPHVQYTQGLEEKSPFALADLYMYLQVVRFWEKANYPCVAKVHSLKISVIDDQIESS